LRQTLNGLRAVVSLTVIMDCTAHWGLFHAPEVLR
jgi:hypothetical protein